jgi:hypothetical protein
MDEYGSRKRKQGRDRIDVDSCAARMLSHTVDQHYCCDIINYLDNTFQIDKHYLKQEFVYYTLEFHDIKTIEVSKISGLIKNFPNIRDVIVRSVSAIDSSNSKPYFIMFVQVFPHDADHISRTVPTFTPFSGIDNPLTKEAFKDALDPHGQWKQEWTIPFNTLSDISHALCNIEEHPPCISLNLIYEVTNSDRDIYALKAMNFLEISYSFLEYIDTITAKNYLYHIKFDINDDKEKNIFVIKITERVAEMISETLEGCEFISKLPKRKVLESTSFSSTRRPEEESRIEEGNVYSKKGKVVNVNVFGANS